MFGSRRWQRRGWGSASGLGCSWSWRPPSVGGLPGWGSFQSERSEPAVFESGYLLLHLGARLRVSGAVAVENPALRPCPGDSPRVPEAFLRWVVAEGPAGRGDGAPFRPRSEVSQRKVRRGSTCARQSGICAYGKGQQERKKSRKRPRNAVLSLR